MPRFVGRLHELAQLHAHLQAVRDNGSGRFLAVRGRRQVGKSRLVEEFLATANAPSVFFAAAKGESSGDAVRSFASEVARSDLDASTFFADAPVDRWEPALRLLSANLATPSIVVVDELPYLIEEDPTLEGVLQRVWDRHLSRQPVLLIAVGSDLALMEILGSYGRPLYQRFQEMIVNPLTLFEVAALLELGANAAFDAYIVLGGFPALAEAWSINGLSDFLASQLSTSTSPLVIVGERILNAEFPPPLQARSVLLVVGSGETTFSRISNRAGINEGSLTRTLNALVVDKRVVVADRALSATPSRNVIYRIADPYLRFWLRFIGPGMELVLRGRGDVVARQIAEQWQSYRGRAVEPVIRESLERLLPDERFGTARHVGSYWTRNRDIEVDLVGSHDRPARDTVAFVGSIKWRDRAPFDRHDIASLAAARPHVPGAEHAKLIGVSRSGFMTTELDVALDPDHLLEGWAR